MHAKVSKVAILFLPDLQSFSRSLKFSGVLCLMVASSGQYKAPASKSLTFLTTFSVADEDGWSRGGGGDHWSGRHGGQCGLWWGAWLCHSTGRAPAHQLPGGHRATHTSPADTAAHRYQAQSTSTQSATCRTTTRARTGVEQKMCGEK